jgi:mannose-6-phosphate isomerase-like protein (cupin superfamily)
MTIRLQFDRIPPGVEVGPNRQTVETLVYLAAGELVFEHGEELERRAVLRAGDVLYQGPGQQQRTRNEGTTDALALLASTDPDPRRLRSMLREPRDDANLVARHASAIAVEGDGVQRRLLVRPGAFGSTTFTLTEVELARGAVDEWHRHRAAEHALVVLEGRGVVLVGQIEEILEPLTGIRVDPGLPHRIENTGRTSLRLLVWASPGVDPLVDRQSAEAPRRRGSA